MGHLCTMEKNFVVLAQKHCYSFWSLFILVSESKLISGQRRHWYLDAQLLSARPPLHHQKYTTQYTHTIYRGLERLHYCCRNPFVGTIFISLCPCWETCEVEAFISNILKVILFSIRGHLAQHMKTDKFTRHKGTFGKGITEHWCMGITLVLALCYCLE